MTPENYRRERQLRGTQSGVAAMLGVHSMTVTQRELGKQRITKEAWLALLSIPLAKKARRPSLP